MRAKEVRRSKKRKNEVGRKKRTKEVKRSKKRRKEVAKKEEGIR